MSTSETDVAWPNRKDRLFKSRLPSRDKVASAPPPEPTFEGDYVNWLEAETWELRYRGQWFDAGETLAKDLARHEAAWSMIPPCEPAGICLPMLYCYRHYLEVSLKRLIRALAKHSPSESPPLGSHNLKQLWDFVQAKNPRATIADLPGDRGTDEHAGRLISEFDCIDPTSQTFRYRRDKHNNPHEKYVPASDLQQLMDVMRKLRRYIEAAISAVEFVVWLKTDPEPE